MRLSLIKPFALVSLLLLFSCSSKDDEQTVKPINKKKALTFATVGASAYTRSITRASLEDTHKSFCVWVKKNMPGSTVQTVMDGYKVEYRISKPGTGGETWGDGSSETNGLSFWSYDHIPGQAIRYWDESALSYTFRAIAPARDYAEGDIEISPDNLDITLKNLPGNVQSGSTTDYLVAITQRQGSDGSKSLAENTDQNDAYTLYDYDCIVEVPGQTNYDPTSTNGNGGMVHRPPTTPTADVPLNFHHIYSTVEFRAKAAGQIIQITSFKVSIPEEETDEIPLLGDYTTNYTTGNGWTISTEDELKTKQFCDMQLKDENGDPGVTLGLEDAVSLTTHLEIPHSWDAGRKLKITITDSEGNEYKGQITLDDETNESCSWDIDRHYIYTLVINAESKNIILFAVDMETWKWKEGSAQDDTQTNW